MAITQVISTIPQAGHRGVDARDTFVTKQEEFQDALTDTFVTEINAFRTQANTLETNVNTKEATVVAKEALMNPHYSAIDAINSNIADVNTVADNIVDIQNAEENAILAINAKNDAEDARDIAIQARDEAVGAVSSLPDGVINDNTTTLVDTWSSSKINTELGDKQDTLVSGTNIKTINSTSLLGSGDITVSDSTKLPLTGGTMTGAITSLKETSVAMPANDINLANGNLFTKTISGATTLTVSNVPTAGTVGYFILQLTNAGSSTVTWFSGVKWAGGTAPTLTASGVDVLSFYTIDAGSTWKVVSIQKDIK